MRTMIEIEWLDGRMTKVPELVLGDAFGESVQAELDFGKFAETIRLNHK